MINLDIATASNTFIVTLQEKTLSADPTYKLELFNFYTNETFYWTGLKSVANDRKDIITLTFSNEFIGRIPIVGQYKYSFYEYMGLTTSGVSYSIVETGMARIIDSSTQSNYIYIQPSESDDDYLTL